MTGMKRRLTTVVAAGVLGIGLLPAGGLGQIPPAVPSGPPTILPAETCALDLDTALRLAGTSNPELQLARSRVTEAIAVRQLAAAQILPNLNAGANYDAHRGVLQQSSGTILRVDRDSAY